jgi:hypothetical protein
MITITAVLKLIGARVLKAGYWLEYVSVTFHVEAETLLFSVALRLAVKSPHYEGTGTVSLKGHRSYFFWIWLTCALLQRGLTVGGTYFPIPAAQAQYLMSLSCSSDAWWYLLPYSYRVAISNSFSILKVGTVFFFGPKCCCPLTRLNGVTIRKIPPWKSQIIYWVIYVKRILYQVGEIVLAHMPESIKGSFKESFAYKVTLPA